MSEEQLKAFLEAVKADVGLQEKLKAASDADAVVVIAKAAGFVISADDLKQAQSEVSDKDLESAAGGQAVVSLYLSKVCFPCILNPKTKSDLCFFGDV